MAIRIFVESFWAIFGNIGQAFRVSVLPLAILYLCLAVLVANPGARGLLFGDASAPDLGLLPLIFAIVFVPLSVFVFAWVAVSWHRLLLREERSDVLPVSRGRPILPYVGQSMLIWIPSTMVAFIGLFAIGLLVAFTLGPNATDNLGGIIRLCGAVMFAYLWLRWGMALVGTAVEKPMKMRDAWRATRTIKATVLGVAVLIVLVSLGADVVATAFGTVSQSVDLFVSVALGWITVMLGISVLTTLYGYCVEGRH